MRRLVEDPAPALNTALLLRLAAEITAVVLVAVLCVEWFDSGWVSVLVAAGAMLVVSFVAIGVAPRTLGRQHAERVALVMAGPLLTVTRVLGSPAASADPAGQRADTGQGVPGGTVRE